MTETRFKISVPRFQRSPVDTFLFSQMMKTVKVTYKPKPILSIDKIRGIIIDKTGYDPYHQPEVQFKEYVKARQLFIYFVRQYTELTQTAVGNLIGKNHSTVCWAESCVKKFTQLEADYAILFNSIESDINKN